MQAPKSSHMHAAKRVLGYLKKSPCLGILLSTSCDLQLHVHCDSEWASCPISRKSLTDYFISLGSSPISSKTKK